MASPGFPRLTLLEIVSLSPKKRKQYMETLRIGERIVNNHREEGWISDYPPKILFQYETRLSDGQVQEQDDQFEPFEWTMRNIKQKRKYSSRSKKRAKKRIHNKNKRLV
ncbi:MAG: hypothetical protein EZS28_031426 [Streblomastix strix]|uniref:Uncharacterized protein n=1 Tax=Streblomastix strix TaxID=222440 RepID=A0A5J4URG9_9EUKA|nr:MAG: hypothetical protein EZS28_031426 [Streblomastix strix]